MHRFACKHSDEWPISWPASTTAAHSFGQLSMVKPGVNQVAVMSRSFRKCRRRPHATRAPNSPRDSGVGVKESELERIFEHFVSSKPQGLGMGLAISRSIVEAHGGRIWAENRPEGGARFALELPYEEANHGG